MDRWVNNLLIKYYAEAASGLSRDKTPSELNRGEGTETDYYLLKIDIVNSTIVLLRKSPNTYLKFAHVFLSTIDDITRNFGADEKQVEYAGDAVIAYFPSNRVAPVDVLKAAYYCYMAASRIPSLGGDLATLPIRSRTIVHRGKLIVADIGPWGDRRLTAVGLPLHKVGHLEKNVAAGAGLATKEFGDVLPVKSRNILLSENFVEEKVPIPTIVVPTPPTRLPTNALIGGLLGLGAPRTQQYPSGLGSRN